MQKCLIVLCTVLPDVAKHSITICSRSKIDAKMFSSKESETLMQIVSET